MSVDHDGVAHDVVHLTHVESQFCAVSSAEPSAFGDGVVYLELGCHFAIGLRGVGVHRRQAMCMGIVDRREEVDVVVVFHSREVRLEAHVVGAFHLKHHAQAFLGVAQR